QDYDDFYPLSVYPNFATGKPRAFTVFDAVLPYVKNSQILQCASSPQEMDWDAYLMQTPPSGCFGGQLGPSMGNFRYLSYNANYAVFQEGQGNPYFRGGGDPPLNMSAMPRVADTTIFYDGYLC